MPFPLAELVLRGSGLVPDFRVLQFEGAANLSAAHSFQHGITEKSHFIGITMISLREFAREPPKFDLRVKQPPVDWSVGSADRPAGHCERVCCLLVLNLVSSTLSCIRQPRPRRRSRLCPVKMSSAAPATPNVSTGMDEASRSAAKTPAAARQLIAQHTSAVASISVQQLTETWQAQIEYLQEATVSRPGVYRNLEPSIACASFRVP